MTLYKTIASKSSAQYVLKIAKKTLDHYILMPAYESMNGVLEECSVIEFCAYTNQDVINFFKFFDKCMSDSKIEWVRYVKWDVHIESRGEFH